MFQAGIENFTAFKPGLRICVYMRKNMFFMFTIMFVKYHIA